MQTRPLLAALAVALAVPAAASAERGDDGSATGAAVTAMALRQIRADHGAEPVRPEDLGRIEVILAGQHLRDYEPRPLTGVAIIDAHFGAQEPADATDLATMLRSPDGMRLIAAMSPEQIAALAKLVQETGSGRNDALPGSGALDPAAGIPALGGMRPGSLTAPASLLLANWRLARDPDGTAYMEDPDLPGSRLDLAEGLVVGALGAVAAIEEEGNTLAVRFSSGETLKATFAPVGMPALPAEILVARKDTPAQQAAGLPDQAALPAPPRTAAASDRRVEKPKEAVRPRARPATLQTSQAEVGAGIPARALLSPPPRPADLAAARTGD